MSTSVVILASCYDSATFYSYEWASELHKDLVRAGHQCIFLDAELIGQSGTALSEPIARSIRGVLQISAATRAGTRRVSHSGYVGHAGSFGFETANHNSFKEVVNPSVIKFIGGATKEEIARQLHRDWDTLRHNFMAGRYTRRESAFAAAQWAAKNMDAIGHC